MTLQENIQNYLNKTRFYKAVLILLFVSIIAGLAYFFTTQQNEAYNYEEQDAGGKIVPIEEVTTKIENPKFYGFDMEKNPFTIIAKDGTQQSENSVDLRDVFSEINSAQQLINITADSAQLALDSKNIHLDKNIFIVIDKEYNISTEHADIDFKNSSAQGASPIRLESRTGVVEGNSFEVRDNFNTIIIKNGVHTNLVP